MKTTTATLFAFLVCGLAAGPLRADDPVVYSQPAADYEDTTWDSYTAPGATPATVYDNFTLTNSGRITAVQWHGDYIDHNNLNNNPAPGRCHGLYHQLLDGQQRPARPTDFQPDLGGFRVQRDLARHDPLQRLQRPTRSRSTATAPSCPPPSTPRRIFLAAP